MRKQTLNVAVVGLGWWGRIIAATAMRESRLIKLVRLTDSSAAAFAATTEFAHIPFSTRFEDVLEDKGVEAVILVTPHGAHEAQVAAAAAAGKHVFCEKPLGLTRASVERSIRACQRAAVVLGVGHERRFETPVEDLRALVLDGHLGVPLQVEANFSHDRFVSLPKSNWRLCAEEAPAAGMTGPGIHLLDLAVAFLGEARHVVAHVATLATDFPAGDTLGFLASHRSGATSYVAATLATPFISRFALYGSKGWVEIRDKAHVEKPEGWWVQQQLAGQPLARKEYSPMNAVLRNLEAFATAALGRAAYPIDSAALLATASAMEAVLQSARAGGAIVHPVLAQAADLSRSATK